MRKLAIYVAAWTLPLLLGAANLQAQGLKVPNPRAFGLDLPPGIVSHDLAGSVEVRDEEGNQVVGRIHVAIGSNMVIELPDGTLVTRGVTEARRTDAPFKAIDKKELAKRMEKKFPGFQTRTSRHYVFVYNTSDEFAEVTMRILESMIPGMQKHAKAQRIDVHEPDVPLVAIMFATEAEYKAFSELPDGIVAFYDTLANHVVMYERPTDPPLKQDLYLKQAISTIAHEGAHQILHNIGVQQRLSRWPMWISEGIAEYYAPTDFGTRMKWKGAGDINDMRMFELESYIKGKDAEQADGVMVEQTVKAARLTSTGYASAWGLTHYLASQRRSDFNQLMRELSEIKPMEGSVNVTTGGIIPSNQEDFSKHFGTDLSEIEKGMIQHLKSQQYSHPFAEFAHFAATVRIVTGGKAFGTANVFHSQELASQWQTQQVKKLPPEQQAGAQREIRLFPNRGAAERFASQWLRTVQ
ncbi:DUF1570 domain-containing protein [Blastopirellula sp. JC732]|uniref:DUF1570 domain-containing protein n=1 Tax=Blastopirellula sediminis TaxID=2894196 RepID=A0A9X1MK17_9BACT|nr:DUF1570 domain-containing protein [Blastopirellula sediminis]MCC9607870.1 DUF1570 domain-containing protein [Blastopirellula sediminis]MCC9627337.1 DUF1570 domain-containing protein [Blastopirellula sediminis]